jgi:flagellar operon protein
MAAPIQNNKIAELTQARMQPAARPAATGAEFATILADRLKLSGHAQTRLASRDIQLQHEDWDRVLRGVERAAEKGARESLVLLDDVALVVSVKNRTVITALDKQQMRENVFTNIDSAVIV